MPEGTKTILAVWSFKRKRLPGGTIIKWKARLCCHGGMQKWGINYWETYAPVVGLASVRLLLLIAAINRIPTRLIDFVLAFPQATLDVPVYMELPYGFARVGQSKRDGIKSSEKLIWFEKCIS